MPNKVTVSDATLRQAAEEGMDAFVDIFVDAISASVGGELTADTMTQLNASQITLLAYRILRDAEAYYPEEARSLGYSATVSVTGRVLVGTDGGIESVRILTDAPNLGFRQAAEEAFWRMRFAPIVYQGHPIKLWFEKTLIFQP